MKSLQYTLLISSIVASLTPVYHSLEIIGGHEVKPHSKPYMASFQVCSKTKNSYVHNCGGALIRRRWVLTAAHCKLKQRIIASLTKCSTGFIRVVLGAHSLSWNEKSQQKFQVEEQHPHPDFNNDANANDIMLLKLSDEAKIDEYVKLLKLPTDKNADVTPGTRCTVAGWGATEPNSHYPSVTLQGVDLTVVDRETCNSDYRGDPKITQDMICAGDSQGIKDSYKGDSGGPLICNGVYKAIVTAGPDVPDPKMPGIYTLLSKKYLDWIEKITGVQTYNMTAAGLY